MKTQQLHVPHQMVRFIHVCFAICVLIILFTFQAKSETSVHIYGDAFKDGFLTVNGVEAGSFRKGVYYCMKLKERGKVVIKVFVQKPKRCKKMLVKYLTIKSDTQCHLLVTKNGIESFNPSSKSTPFCPNQFLLEETDELPIVQKRSANSSMNSQMIIHFIAPANRFYHIYVNDKLIGGLGPNEHLKYTCKGHDRLAIRVKSDTDYIRVMDAQSGNEQYLILTPKYIGETYVSKGKKLLKATGHTIEVSADSY